MVVEGYRFIHRDVKYPRLEFKTGELVLILPRGDDPEEVMKRHLDWIEKKRRFIEKCLEDSKDKELAERDEQELKELVHSLIDVFSRELGVEVNRVYFRRMKTKWASCSPKRNLTVNTLTRYLPAELIEYVVFHEMVHLLERRHNERFWDMVAKRFANYEGCEGELFSYWFLIHQHHAVTWGKHR